MPDKKLTSLGELFCFLLVGYVDYLIGYPFLPWLPGSSVPNLRLNHSDPGTPDSQCLFLSPFYGFAFLILVE